LKHASVVQNGKVEIKNPEHMYQYMGMWEVSSTYRRRFEFQFANFYTVS
jgi:hypothetical protein